LVLQLTAELVAGLWSQHEPDPRTYENPDAEHADRGDQDAGRGGKCLKTDSGEKFIFHFSTILSLVVYLLALSRQVSAPRFRHTPCGAPGIAAGSLLAERARIAQNVRE